jgi:tRNA A-37 threonylcarbamoyl transferase component Bud32
MAHEPPPARAGTPHSNEAPAVGSVLGGRFRVVRQLGEGGMGVVLEAENTLTGKRVAIKWMRAALASKPEAVERFLREARASARVRHPNVVDVYDVVHEADSAFLVMELLEGEPLTAVLERGGMPAPELISLLLDAMRGVAAAHKQGVIHRDIKPDNIFLAQEADRARRTAKVLDFGISKLSDASGLSLTQTGTALGTPLYMSFEQLCGVRDIDARTDVYAFGVILYEALTGRPPFEAETFTELIIKITNTRPAAPKAVRADIPKSLDSLIQSAMAKERSERVPSLDALIRELEPFASAENFRAQMTADRGPMLRLVMASQPPAEQAMLLSERAETGSADTPMSADLPAPAVPRRRSAMLWLLAGTALAALLAGLMMFGPAPAPSPAGATPRAAGSGARASDSASAPAQATGAAATLPPTAAEPVPLPDALPTPAADIPAGKAPPAAAPSPAPPAAHKPLEPARTKPKPLAALPRPVARPEPRPVRAAVEPTPLALPVEAPPPAPPAPAAPRGNRPKPRAGSLNSQDF